MFDAGRNLNVLKGNETTKAEDFVLRTQKVADAEGFRNVSKIWYDKTMSYEQGEELLANDKAKTEDIAATVNAMMPTVNERGQFVMRYIDGREFRPTKFAMSQIGTWSGTGTWYVEELMKNPTNAKGKELFSRDREDAETLVRVIQNGFRRIDADKQFLFRTWSDGTLRAMLSDRYAVVDNRWLLEVFKTLIPGGRLSHWKGNADTIYGNILIPDTIRKDEDSDYGGMLSIGNSEIGERRVSSSPSIFRAICMNGCIWGAVQGTGIRQVHRGNIDLNQLFAVIKENLEKQIPLLPQGIEKLLGTRKFGWDGASMKPLFAQVAKQNRMTKRQAESLLAAYDVELQTTPEYAKGLFGLVNSITRAGQKLDPATWVRFDEIAGEMIGYDSSDWLNFASRAKSLSVKEVDEVFAATAG